MKEDSQKNKKSAISRFLRKLDIYGKPIQLTFKGKESFKTTFGGTVSLILLLLLLSVAGYKLNDMIYKNLTVVKKNTLVSASNSYVPPEMIS